MESITFITSLTSITSSYISDFFNHYYVQASDFFELLYYRFFYPRDLMINSLTYDPEVEILTDGQIDALLAKRINELPQRDKALEVKPIEPIEPVV